MRYLTIDDVAAQLKGQYVFCRVDTNVTLQAGKFGPHPRIKRSSETIGALRECGAKVLVGTHNGREGKPDFVTLGGLVPNLEAALGNHVIYIGNTWDGDAFNQEALKRMQEMQPSDVFLLENLRFLPGETAKRTSEEHTTSEFIKALLSITTSEGTLAGVQFYVNDAFSVSHRPHRSVVGFPTIPNIAGLNMHRELTGLAEIKERFRTRQEGRMNVYVLGGKKIDDYFDLIEDSVTQGNVDKILMGGLLGELALFALGYDLGTPTQALLEKEKVWVYRERLRELMDSHPHIFVTPSDVAYEVDGERYDYAVGSIPPDMKDHCTILDIGHETAKIFSHILREQAGLAYVKGPMGFFERWKFTHGSRTVLNAAVNSGEIYSVVGGGDTIGMLDRFGIPLREVRYVSLAGGALIEAMAGKALPGVNALEQNYERFHQSTPRTDSRRII